MRGVAAGMLIVVGFGFGFVVMSVETNWRCSGL
jgi:hypothetical protein